MVKYCVICKEKTKLSNQYIPVCGNSHSGRYCFNCLNRWINQHKSCPECQQPSLVIYRRKRKEKYNLALISAKRLIELQYHNEKYGTMLHRDIINNIDITKYLNVPILFGVTNSSGQTPLELAIEMNKFISALGLIRSQSPLYPMILHNLVKYGSNYEFDHLVRLIDSVINHSDVDLHEIDSDGNTILHLITDKIVKVKRPQIRQMRYISIIKKLLIKGASVSQINLNGETPFHKLCYLIGRDCREEYGIELLKIFLKKKPDLCLSTNDGGTIMASICFSGDLFWYDKLSDYHNVLKPAFKTYFETRLVSCWNDKKNYVLLVNQIIQRELATPQVLAYYFGRLEDECNQLAFEELIKTYHHFIKNPQKITETINQCDDEQIRLANYAILKKYKIN